MELDRITPFTINGEILYYLDNMNNREFRRIWGGLAFPTGITPGFALLVAEDRFRHRGYPHHLYHAILEIEDADISSLLDQCLGIATKLIIDDWRTNTENQADMAWVQKYNTERRLANMPQFRPRPAPLLRKGEGQKDSFKYGIGRILERTRPDKKTLIFEDCPQLQAYLKNIPPEMGSGQGVEEKPPLAALSHVIGSMDFFEPQTGPEQAYADNSGPLYWNDRRHRKDG